MSVFIYPYNPGSKSARDLARGLGIRRIRHQGSRYRPRQNDIIVNWGSSSLPNNLMNMFIVNDPSTVRQMTNKLSFFFHFGGIDSGCVPSTTDPTQVQEWLSQGKAVVARTKLTGHSGEGIVILEGAGAEVVQAPLYTLYIPKQHEYRIHVVNKNGSPHIFDCQRKARKTDVPNEEVDWRVRNLSGGFIYARESIVLPDCVKDCALEIFSKSGLDFGAIDIIYNSKKNKAYALEINTAPGLTGTTLEKYVEMFEEVLRR